MLIGSSAGTAKVTVDALRARGIPAGLVKIRVFRPFPAEELAQTLKNVKALAILDKAESFSAQGRAPCLRRSGRPSTIWSPVPVPWDMSTAWGAGISPRRILRRSLPGWRPLRPGANWVRSIHIWDKGGKRPWKTQREPIISKRPWRKKNALWGDTASAPAAGRALRSGAFCGPCGRRTGRWWATPPAALEVSSFLYPYTAYEDSYIHTAFESAGASLSGVEAAYNALKRKGKVQGEVKFITFGGDGGTYDIGFQSLSGAMERGHDLTYVCYDNEAYMNTGIQRSSSTPRFAKATTSPVGSAIPGKLQNKKNLTEIIAAHHVPYVAQTTFLGNFRDLYTKAQKAIYTPGPSFLNIMAPCPRGWEYPAEKLPEICKLAVETCVWPLFEVIDGVWHLSYQPKQKRPVEEYLRLQGRFRHMFKPGNEWMIEEAQRNVDENWEKLLAKCQG